MVKKFPHMGREVDQIHETQRTPNRLNLKRDILINIIKFSIIKEKKENIESSKRKLTQHI